MLSIVFGRSVSPYNMLFCIQHPQNRGGEVFNCFAEAK